MSEHTIGVTGPNGFIAGHLIRRLNRADRVRILPIPRTAFDDPTQLRKLVSQCDTVVHLAGMNRGPEQEVRRVNVQLAERLADAISATKQAPHIVLASTTQRELANAYGQSKVEAERRLTDCATRTGAPLTILVIPNVYGPGCRPFYNSVVATFCHQLAHGQTPVVIENRDLELIWAGDLADEIYRTIQSRKPGIITKRIEGTARLTVVELLARLQQFRTTYFDSNLVPDLSNQVDANLYTTFMSHIELDDHCHRPEVYSDDRGRLFEIIRTQGGGQVFFSTTKPGVIRGNHFHSRKFEWFCVVGGEAMIRLRRVGDDRVREFRVSGRSPEFISIPALHTHQIENVGNEDLLTMFWCNEVFQPADPDTYYEQVA